MTGLGTLPNVHMTDRLMNLAVLAAADSRSGAYFTADLDDHAVREYETALAGTAVLPELRAFLRRFGHRGPYESDVMSARFAEDRGPVLRLIQLHVRAGAMQDATRGGAAAERDAAVPVRDTVTDDGSAADIDRVDTGTGDAILGYGVSPGIVTGRVRVVRSVEAIGQLSEEIVVLPAIEPTLTPIFPLVGGVIAEMGGLLSHAAIIAREYGLPAVVSARDATRRLRDGDRVELDGTKGRIRLLEPAR